MQDHFPVGTRHRTFPCPRLRFRVIGEKPISTPPCISRSATEGTGAIIFTETWLYPESERLTSINDYKAFFKSNGKNRAGSVAVFIRHDIQCFEIAISDRPACDCCIVGMILGKRRCQLAAIYLSGIQSCWRNAADVGMDAMDAVANAATKSPESPRCHGHRKTQMCARCIHGS